MNFLKLRLLHRLLLSLGLSFSIVLSVALIEWSQNEAWPDETVFAFVALAAVVFLGLSTINQYLVEKSAGWKRLSVVSSVVISSFIGLYIYFDSSSYSRSVEKAMESFAFALPVSFIAILYSKAIYSWIKDGFVRDKI